MLSILNSAKNEILHSFSTDSSHKEYFLHGVFRGIGFVVISSLGLSLRLESIDLKLINLCSELISSIINKLPIITEKTSSSKKTDKKVYSLMVAPEDSAVLIKKLGFGSESSPTLSEHIDFEYFDSDMKMKNLLKGLFVSTGSLSAPKNNAGNSGYYLEMKVYSEKLALDIVELLSKFQIDSKIRSRKNLYSIYIKDAEKISDFLAATNAVNTLFRLQDLIMLRAVSNDCNRGINCNIANINKTIEASATQINAIQKLKDNKILNTLDDSIKSTANLRLEHPELTLSELASILGVSKSCINHRMRKLISLASEI